MSDSVYPTHYGIGIFFHCLPSRALAVIAVFQDFLYPSLPLSPAAAAAAAAAPGMS